MSAVSRYPIVRLASLAHPAKGSMAGGPFGSDLVSADYVNSGVPVIRGTNLPKHSQFSLENCVFVTESKADALHLNCAHPGDLVFTQRGTLGQIGLIPSNTPYSRFLISQSQMKMIVDRSKADPLYIYHYFRLPSTVAYIENHALQAGVPHINLGILRRFEIICPPLATQQKIAAILSAYDDLIANNQRRITLLEQMAEDIYREWFVRLRFPGHEQVKIEKGVPQGWKVLPFSEVVNINPRERINSSIAIPFVPMDALSTSQMYFEVDECRQHASGSKFRNDDVLFPRITPSLENGKRGYVFTLPKDTVGVGSTEFIVFREQELSSEHIYFLTCSPEFRKHAELSMTGASGRQRVSEDCFGFLLVKIPPNELRDKFKFAMSPYFRQIQTLSAALNKLKATRDTLLPRLISGKLTVDALDIHFPPGMLEQGKK